MDQFDLYHPIILEYQRKTEKFRKQENVDLIIDAHNPVCGDAFKIYINVVGDINQEVTYHGYGCAVSKASTAILCEQLEGKNNLEAQTWVGLFNAVMMNPDLDIDISELWQPFRVAAKYPGRLNCATLAWHAAMLHFMKRD